jgi:glycosyltransferase involved in cell wall biosynthesis
MSIHNPYTQGTVIGKPVFGNYNPEFFQRRVNAQFEQLRKNAPPVQSADTPGAGLKRALHFYADYGGCGLWRMTWPELLLNGYGKAVVNSLTQMVSDPNFYQPINAIKLQRQATPDQYEFVKFLKSLQGEFGFKLIYEVDDVVFGEDIPLYNTSRVAFTDPVINETIKKIINLCDEMCVVSPYMRDYYKRKTGKQEINVIPNYAPKFWLHDFYNPIKIDKNYVKNKKKPVIGYMGSGTHFDPSNAANQQDDFAHVIDAVIRTRNKFQWVFLGGIPMKLLPYVHRKEIIHVPWVNIYEMPRVFASLNVNAVVAPIARNEFNRAKSDIKMLEAGALGIPGVFQNLEPYQAAPYKFDTGDEMIAQLDRLLKDRNEYLKQSEKARKMAEKRWLDDHLDEHYEMLFKMPNEKRDSLSANGYN